MSCLWILKWVDVLERQNRALRLVCFWWILTRLNKNVGGELLRRLFSKFIRKKRGSRCGVGVTAGGHQKSKNKICEMEMKIIKEAWQIDFGNEFSSGYVHILKQDTEVWTVFSITREKSKWSSTSENKWDLGWLRNHRRESRFFLTYSYTKFCSLNKSLFFMQFLFIFVRKYFLVEIFTLKTVRRLALLF